MHCIVVGSDGLWDNLDLCEVVQVVDDQLAGAVTEQRVQDVAKDLLRLAVARKRKPDDICVAVIPLLPGGVVP
jgi:serine/threonine protein phosphatase PrpC